MTGKQNKNLKLLYDTALDQFIERIKQDKNILAVYVYGSYVNGILGDHSDIDMIIVTNDEKTSGRYLNLQENGIYIEADVISRSDFRKQQKSFIHGSMTHHKLATSKLVYSIDNTISDFNRDLLKIAERDKELQLMMNTEFLIGCLYKARKALYIEKDLEKCFTWLIYLAGNLARILLLMNNNIPGRDVLVEVRELNNEIINEIMTKPIIAGINESNIIHTLTLVDEFLIKNKKILFKPLFSYLAEAGDARSVSEIEDHFTRIYGGASWSGFLMLVSSFTWLTYHGDLMRIPTPKRITSKSKVTVDENSYYYLRGEMT
ncbi:MAG: nucleotidyltransferase domain-containing protein [Candidatus Hermodarchaeota archaeon]